MATRRDTLWSPEFARVSLTAFLLLTGQTFLLVGLPLLIVRRLQGTSTHVGMLPLLFSGASLIARPLAGWSVDRWGRRWIQIGFLFLVAVFTASYTWVSSFALLALIRVLYGLCYGMANTATNTVVADVTPRARRGEGIAYFGAAQTLGMAVGPSIALAVLGASDFTRLFWVGGAIVAAAALCSATIRHPPVHIRRTPWQWSALLERSVGWIAFTTLLSMFGYGTLSSFVTLYAGQLGIASPGLFFTVQAAGTILARLSTGGAYDRSGPRWIVTLGLACLGLSYALLSLWRAPAGFFSAAFTSGVGLSIALPALQAMAVNRVPPERLGAANATYLSGMDLGLALGGPLLSLVAQVSGSYSTMYLAAACTVLAPLLVFWLRVLPEQEALSNAKCC